MLNSFFISVLNMSIVSSYVIVFVLIVRLLLKKSPKLFSFVLWAVVLFRLLCPISFESVLSILPNNTAPISQDILYSQAPQINTGIGIVDHSINPILPIPNMGDSVNPLQVWSFIASHVWIIGIMVLVIYSIAAFIKLKRKLTGSSPLRDHIYLADHINSPFVMGFINPKIYLPSSLSAHEQDFIIAHEAYHIKRFDHITRILAFVALALHWFNPLVWVAFILSGKDMELSCDGAVTKQMNRDIRGEYTQSLLRFATGTRMVHATPLAFGEGDTKSRVKNVLHYKKPSFWVIGVSVIAIVAAVVGLAANPAEKQIPMNTLYTPMLTQAREAELTTQYGLAGDSTIFQTKVRVDDSIKSYRYYLELYQQGRFIGTFADNYGNITDKNGSITTAYSINRGEDNRWSGIVLTASFLGGGYATSPNIPFPQGFIPMGVATAAIANTKTSTPIEIIPDSPIIIGSMGFQMENSQISAYDCEYLMENPEAIAQYECVYLVKCVFSEKDERELISANTTWESKDAGEAAAEYSLLKHGKNGEALAINLPENQKLAENILMDALVKSAAWEGVDITTLEEYYRIRRTFSENSEANDYYAYRLADGTSVLQDGTDGR